MRNIEISQKENQGVALGAFSHTLALLPHSEEGLVSRCGGRCSKGWIREWVT